MKSKMGKLTLIVIVLIILFSISTNVYAFSQIIEEGKNFIGTGENVDSNIINSGTMQTELQNTSSYIYNLLLTAGIIISVIVATILGIQFMIGGAEGQAKVKEMLVPFVVGCIIVFGAFGFWKIAITIGERMEDVAVITDIEDRYIA